MKPHQKGFTFAIAEFHSLIYWLSITYTYQNMGETLTYKWRNPQRGGFTHHYLLTFRILDHKNRGGETLPLKNFRKNCSCNLDITKPHIKEQWYGNKNQIHHIHLFPLKKDTDIYDASEDYLSLFTFNFSFTSGSLLIRFYFASNPFHGMGAEWDLQRTCNGLTPYQVFRATGTSSFHEQ